MINLPAHIQDYNIFLIRETTNVSMICQQIYQQQHLCYAQTPEGMTCSHPGDTIRLPRAPEAGTTLFCATGIKTSFPLSRRWDPVDPPVLQHKSPQAPRAILQGCRDAGHSTRQGWEAILSYPSQDKARMKKGRRYPRTTKEMRNVTINSGSPRGSWILLFRLQLQLLPSTCLFPQSPADPHGSLQIPAPPVGISFPSYHVPL